MRIAGIVRDSIVDGEGIRDVVFLQGCKHACKGCHNQGAWDIRGGTEVSLQSILERLRGSSNAVTLSGGEPLLQFDELVEFLYLLKRNDCWLYTGYTFEDIPISTWQLLSQWVEVVVDGKFELDKKDSNLLFKGSSNQRIIDLPKSVERNEVVLWEDRYDY